MGDNGMVVCEKAGECGHITCENMKPHEPNRYCEIVCSGAPGNDFSCKCIPVAGKEG